VLSNLYLNEVDRMLEQAQEHTRLGKFTNLEYARFADDLVILINAHPLHGWVLAAVAKRLREELVKLHVQINEEKGRTVDLPGARASDFWASTSAACVGWRENGDRSTRPR